MSSSFQKTASNSFLLVLILCFSNNFAQTINLKDFEKLATIKTVKEYLDKKDFVVKKDSSSGKDNINLKLVNKATKEIVRLSSITGSEGDKLFELEYFTPSIEEYAKIVHAINKSGYTGKGDTRHYYKNQGSYETHNLILKELVDIKGMDYYAIKYSFYAGKELSLPVYPSNK